MKTSRKPRIALVMGDPCGIGPELTIKLLAEPEVAARADIVVVGGQQVYRSGEEIAGRRISCPRVENVTAQTFLDSGLVLLSEPDFDTGQFALGHVAEESGRYQLDCLATALTLCKEGVVDGICFAPLNKEAMHRAGLQHEDESGFFLDHLGHTGRFGLLNTLGNLWTSRATSHVAHRQVSDLITQDAVLEAIRLLDSTLRATGNDTPRIAVAGLNPHAGDGGMFGSEEIEKISPAVKLAQGEGISAEGPFPPDTIFLMGRDGKYDAIVTMYHDQGQIAMKLMGFDYGVTVHAGLPFPITTSAHGSAYDIAGHNVASVNALSAAFTLACSMTGMS
ncbi:MAG: 4-hydroxythreonine-4-phosphate dehydrogenase PdxA [Desulfuromonadales bacterium]|nr:4-hydroxythreonine-4-phosphate dehydrogenase PdxA [Desulfuromonadales bacterium]